MRNIETFDSQNGFQTARDIMNYYHVMFDHVTIDGEFLGFFSDLAEGETPEIAAYNAQHALMDKGFYGKAKNIRVNLILPA